MTVARVVPAVARAAVTAPPSKSYTHRALIAGHLTGARYAVEAPLISDDTRATRVALEVLGSRVRPGRTRWQIEPAGRRPRAPGRIDCGESGTTLRFTIPLAARSGRRITFRGRGRLAGRPIAELLDALESLGAETAQPSGPGTFPLEVEGPIRGGRVRLDASRSSQFASALLLTLPTLTDDSQLALVGPIVSEPYVEATLAVLRHHRIRVDRRGRRFEIPGGQRFRGNRMRVPGDASSGAYLWAAAGVTGGTVRVRGVPGDWPQADLAILELLASAGARVRRSDDGWTVSGRVVEPFDAELTGSPDLYPLAAVVAATIPGRSRLRGAAHVVHKESDRRAGSARIAQALGAEVDVGRDELRIRGREVPRPIRIRDLDDHRLVMSAAVGALAAAGPSTIGDARAVRKSFPGFWNALTRLGTEAAR
jgi:3-phosphoshikimate 1-carboxyvinyltransferase